MTAIPGRLSIDAEGRLVGPAKIQFNDPWPCPNGSWGSGAIQGSLMHTMVGYMAGTIETFNNTAAQASANCGVGRDGLIHQFGPFGKGWISWHAAAANLTWYGWEFEDDGNPDIPLTLEQIVSGAQLVEFSSRFTGYPLQVTDRPAGRGFGTHVMGGLAWSPDGHTCPDLPPQHVRSAQRQAIVDLAVQIRHGGPPPAELEGALVLPNLTSRKVLSGNGGKTWG